MHHEVTIVIDATPEQVWEVLVDAPAWSSWDSGVVRVDRPLEQGQKISLVSSVNPDRAFKLEVSDLEPARRIELSSGMPLGLFKGVRTYDLSEEGDGTRFTMREDFTGPMSGMITKSMPDMQPSFDQFAAGLKQRVETGRGT